MKKLIPIIITALISCFTVFILTTLFDKKENIDLANINQNDSIITNISDSTKMPVVIKKNNDTAQNTTNVSIKEIIISDYEILKSVEKAQLYLNSETKTKDMLIFHRTKLNSQYKIEGLSKETNEILLSTIVKINKELEKFNETIENIKIITDSSEVKKIHNDTIQMMKFIERDTTQSNK